MNCQYLKICIMPVLIDSLINILLKSPFQNQNLVLNWLSSLSFLFRRFLWLHKNGLMVLDILSNYSNQRHNKNNAFSGNSFYITNYKILTDIKHSSFTSARSFGRLLRFHHVGMGICHVIGYCQLQQEL